MAFSYSENLANFDQWTFRQTFDDSSWMSSIHETETLTKALQQSFSSDYSSEEAVALAALVHQQQQQQFVKPESTTTTTTTTPTVSGSDPETTSKQQQQRRNNNTHQILKGKITKRKSRATNRSPITFITADPMNFRQMVQQVTGIRIGGANGGGGGGGSLQMPVTQILKPEAKRPGEMMLMNGGYNLPTLDTSAFLLEQQQRQQQQQQQQQQLMGSTTSSTVTSPTHVSYHAPVAAQVNTSFDFDTFQSFPTLESWGAI